MKFHELLKEMRLSDGYGLREFAEHISVTPSSYCDVEHGRIRATPFEMTRIVNVFQGDMRVVQLLGLWDQAFVPEPPLDMSNMVLVHAKTVDGKPLTELEVQRLLENIQDPTARK